jgi:ADP-heptose:LPS heptosyltransferase
LHPDQTVTPDPSVRKVLIYRLGSLGDTVVALPCFHLIERKYPNAERRLLTNFPIHAKAPAAAAVLGDSGLVHGYMRYTVGTRSPRELLRLAGEIRRFRPDVLVYLMPVRPARHVARDKWYFRLVCGVGRIVGAPGREELENRVDPATGLYESEASRLARSLAELGDAHAESVANWDPRLSRAESDAAERALAGVAGYPLIVCSPGCKMQANDWEPDNWRALLDRLWSKYGSYALVLTGAKEDHAVCESVSAGWAGEKVNLAGSLTPRESAAVFRKAAVFLGPDSGPKSLASSVGAPCVCVFSARGLPGKWFPVGDRNIVIYHEPECHGCGLETCITEKKKCILSVTVDEVEQAVDRVLLGQERWSR